MNPEPLVDVTSPDGLVSLGAPADWETNTQTLPGIAMLAAKQPRKASSARMPS